MSLPTSHLAYSNEYAHLRAAVDDDVGIRIRFPTFDAAQTYRSRLNMARAIERRRSTEVYSPGDPGYGVSAYDGLQCVIRTLDSGTFVYIHKLTAAGSVEKLSDLGGELPPKPARVEGPPLQERLSLVRRV